jgi:hypothetical protein
LYGIFARAYLKKGFADSSIFYALQGLHIASKMGTIEFMRDNAQALADAYAYKRDFANAYSITFSISITGIACSTQKWVTGQLCFSIIANWKKSRRRSCSSVSKRKYKEAFLSSVVIALALILITAVLLLRNNRQKQKANNLLRRQKQEIDRKQKILSSLTTMWRCLVI